MVDLFIPVRAEPSAQLEQAVRTAENLAGPAGVSVYIVCGADDDTTRGRLSHLLHRAEGVQLAEVPTCAPKARAMNEVVRRSSAAWIGFLDVDVAVSAAELMSALDEAEQGRLDYAEFVELSAGPGRVTRLLNMQSVLFQMANTYLGERLGGRYFASSGLLLRRSFVDRVGRWPEDGCEEGYRWSLTAAGHPQHGLTSRVPAYGRPAAGLRHALRQRRRWYQGQLHAAVDCLRPGYPSRGRLLGLLGGVSLLAQAGWTASFALGVTSRRARRVFALLGLLEAVRLVVAVPLGGAAPPGRGRDIAAFLAFELVEGLTVLSAVVPASPAGGWRPTQRG
ncbi:Glycosyltransferase like family 2 [Micromonospora mirobrigensis]|uniref:Glycosyltransferase like family 2 n=1 Tax=Micromonospora mirobrigensis TaxID=262898 RepID=A0A1C4ZBP5_9ACTN|nr:Glycosyltransferase like family 2 [Micromonospora mirobrigensis]